jgi:hypothetical protein
MAQRSTQFLDHALSFPLFTYLPRHHWHLRNYVCATSPPQQGLLHFTAIYVPTTNVKRNSGPMM